MSDLFTKIKDRLNEAEKESQENKSFINKLALNSKIGPDENEVADFIVNEICKKGEDRLATELLLDELATIDSKISSLDYQNGNLTIEREKTIKDGRPDIVITVGSGEEIFIENKILATDQRGQIKHYYDAKPYSLIYLTRFGHKASTNSECGLKAGKDYFLASYYKHIYNWIKKLIEKQPEDEVSKFQIWLNNQIYGLPDLYALILSNREKVESDISVVEKCGDGFRQFVMWQRIIPALQNFAKENNLSFEISDRFEFKENNSHLRFITSDGKEIKINCGARKNNTWSGINVNGVPIIPDNWDSAALLHYENIIDSITEKVKDEITAIQ